MRVHDPDGYVCTPLPLDDFMVAWKADGMYTRKRYMQWRIGERLRRPSTEEIYRAALARGLEQLRRTSEPRGETTVMRGVPALRALAADVGAGRAEQWLRPYSSFSFRVSAQRCFDSANFLREAPFTNPMLQRCAELRLEQARCYGDAQLAAVARDLPRLAQALEAIATSEEALAPTLDRALRSAA